MEWIIKTGFFTKKQTGKKQPGLDLSKAVADFLIKHGVICQKGCCTYQFNGLYEAYKVYTPSTGDTLVLDGCASDHVINGDAEITALTINFPPPKDGMVVKISFAQAVTTLTIDETILGEAESSPEIGDQLVYKYYETIGWMRKYNVL